MLSVARTMGAVVGEQPDLFLKEDVIRAVEFLKLWAIKVDDPSYPRLRPQTGDDFTNPPRLPHSYDDIIGHLGGDEELPGPMCMFNFRR